MDLPFELGPYRAETQLGFGAFSTVYKATHIATGRTVALKVLRAEMAQDEQIRKMFMDEARLLVRVDHPNVVSAGVIDELKAPGLGTRLVLEMEYVDGVCLGALLTGPLPASVALDLALQAARGLRHLHGLATPFGEPLELVHRDIKPENLLISRDGVLKLVDLGISKSSVRLASATETGLTRGSPQYMSPEQVEGAKSLDFRSDFFSLGAVLWRCLFGRLHIEGSSLREILAQVFAFSIDDELQGLGGLSTGLQELLRGLLAHDVEDRYSSTEAVVRALEAEVAVTPPGAQTPSDYLREAVATTRAASEAESLGPTAVLPTRLMGRGDPVTSAGVPHSPMAQSPSVAPWIALSVALPLLIAGVMAVGLLRYGDGEEQAGDATTEAIESAGIEGDAPVSGSGTTVDSPSVGSLSSARHQGTLRLAADHRFVLTVDGRRFSEGEARRGFALAAGPHLAKLECLECPPGVVPIVEVTVQVEAGSTHRETVSFSP